MGLQIGHFSDPPSPPNVLYLGRQLTYPPESELVEYKLWRIVGRYLWVVLQTWEIYPHYYVGQTALFHRGKYLVADVLGRKNWVIVYFSVYAFIYFGHFFFSFTNAIQ